MKKSFIAMGLAVAAISFAGCNKVELADNNFDEVKGGQAFELVAGTQMTKTTDNGTATLWAANDALTVFHAEAGTTTYGSNDQFTITEANLETGTFTGTLTESLDGEKSYDWYAIYPYNSNYTTPANTTCYQEIKNKQTQTGYGSTAHLSGANFPLVGKATSVSGADTPSITMKQVCSVIKLEVTNNSGEDLYITSASITSSKVNLAGGYFIDFSGDAAVLVDEDAEDETKSKYMFKTVDLTVTGGTAIADGAKAVLYIGVKPFVANDETLKISVNGYEKDLVIGTTDVTFAAGQMKKISFNYDKEPESTDYVFYESFAACNGTGGNDDAWSGSIAATAFTDSKTGDKSDNSGWALTKGNAADECIKLGANGTLGSATTPAIALDATKVYTLTFKAGAWKGDATDLLLSINSGLLSAGKVTLADSKFTDYTVYIAGAGAGTKITFSAGKASKNRFFLDEVKVVEGGDAVAVTSLTLNMAELELNVKASETLTATVAPETATFQNVTWSSDDETVATVDAAGKVTGVAAGTATITATAVGGATASCSVSVVEAVFETKTIGDLYTASQNIFATLAAAASKSFDSSLVGQTYAGYIAGNNAGGNLGTMIAVVDKDATASGHGILIYGSAYGTVDNYPVGKKVTIEITSGSQVKNQSGMMELMDVAVTVDEAAAVEMAPLTVAASDLSAAYTGMRVKVQGLQLDATGLTKWLGTLSFKDASSNSIAVYTRSNAPWKDEYISNSKTNGSISGVVTVYTTTVQVCPLSSDDIADFEYTEPLLTSVNPNALSWDADATAAKTITVSGINLTASDIEVSLPENPHFTAVVTNATTITVTPKEANSGTAAIENTLTITVGTSSKEVTLTHQAPGAATGTVVLSEEFDNDTTTDSNAAISSSEFSNFSGATSKAYTSKFGGLKLGSSKDPGYITSKSLDLSKPFTVSLNVLKYSSDAGKVQVTVGSVTKEITPTITDTVYTLEFDAATSASTVKIGTTTNRAYIDNVVITTY